MMGSLAMKKKARASSIPGRTCILSYNDVKRGHGDSSPNNLVNHVCVCVILSHILTLLHCLWPPYQPEPSPRPAQLRRALCTRHM